MGQLVPDPEMDALRAEYGARWRRWRGRLSGTYYAIRADREVQKAYQLHADTAAALLEQICRADAQDEDLPIFFFGAVRPVSAANPGIGGQADDA